MSDRKKYDVDGYILSCFLIFLTITFGHLLHSLFQERFFDFVTFFVAILPIMIIAAIVSFLSAIFFKSDNSKLYGWVFFGISILFVNALPYIIKNDLLGVGARSIERREEKISQHNDNLKYTHIVERPLYWSESASPNERWSEDSKISLSLVRSSKFFLDASTCVQVLDVHYRSTVWSRVLVKGVVKPVFLHVSDLRELISTDIC
ncbi:hypothetical protein [Dinoroseobacter sp. S76]|uniref:hypothetical protein n=1 Tax=Dinoroseobacter sp. S76 TaxID=3415124 RepID=UPI003C7E37FB